MVEPQHKRVKLPTRARDLGDLPMADIHKLHELLGNKCLCSLSLHHIVQILHHCNAHFAVLLAPGQMIKDTRGCLQYASLLTLFFEVALKQRSRGVICARISEVVLAGAENESDFINLLLGFLSHKDKLLSYSAVRAIVSLLLLLQGELGSRLLHRLAEIMRHSTNWLEVCHAFEIVKRIIDWKEIDEHPLENAEPQTQSTECNFITLTPTDVRGAKQFKSVVARILDSRWKPLVVRSGKLLVSGSVECINVVVLFLSLWISIISVKNSLNIDDTKKFFCGLEKFVKPLLCSSTPVVVWDKILDLFNEVLCYGSTLALQEVLDDEPCNLAHVIIRSVNTQHLLEFVPCEQPAEDPPQSHSDSSFVDDLDHPKSDLMATSASTFLSQDSGYQSLHYEPQDQFREKPSMEISTDHVKDGISDLSINQCQSTANSMSTSVESQHPSESLMNVATSSSHNSQAVNNIEIIVNESMNTSPGDGVRELSNSLSLISRKAEIASGCSYKNSPDSRQLEENVLYSNSKESCVNMQCTLPLETQSASSSYHPSHKYNDTRSPASVQLSLPSTSHSQIYSSPSVEHSDALKMLSFYNDSDDDDDDEDEIESQSSNSSPGREECFSSTHLEVFTSKHRTLVPDASNFDNSRKASDEVDLSYRSNANLILHVNDSNSSLEANSHLGANSRVDFPSDNIVHNSSDLHLRVVVFRKTVLLVLKSVAVTVKEARGESSSSSSSENNSPRSTSQDSDTEEIDMEIISRSLSEVLEKTDSFVKRHEAFHPHCPIAEWMVKLFSAQDDWMVEAMVCGLDIHSGLAQAVRGPGSEIGVWLCPHTSFLVFLDTIRYDSSVLLDLLVSSETCFLLYLLRYLKLAKRSWPSAESLLSAGNNTNINPQDAINTMVSLRMSLIRLVAKELFPYNIDPVLRLLDQCEHLFGARM